MNARLLADAVLLVHLLFILFVIAGGFLALRWRKLAWIHLPAAAWGALVEFTGRICPLTPLENRLRLEAGLDDRFDSFVERYLLPLIYPDALTREIQILLGLGVVAINLLAYWLYWRCKRPPLNCT
jgi:hypothetical protein